MIYLSKKGSEKGRVWIEIQCNISHLKKRKNALNQRFSYVLIRIEPLLNFYLSKKRYHLYYKQNFLLLLSEQFCDFYYY